MYFTQWLVNFSRKRGLGVFLFGLAMGFGVFLGAFLHDQPDAFQDVAAAPDNWTLQVLAKDSHETLTKITPFVLKHGRDVCYVFVQDFAKKTPEDYRGNLAVSCRRQQGLFW